MLKNEHIHKYMRVLLGDNYIVFKCMLPGCPHYVRKELFMGRKSLCWRCGGIFIISQKNLEQKKVHCKGCKRKKHESLTVPTV